MHSNDVTRISLTMLSAIMLALAPGAGALAQRKAVPAATPQSPSLKVQAPALDGHAVAEGRRELDNNLLDYPRARFRAVRLIRSKMNFTAFCGEINVTNRMGGYNGWQPFVLPLGEDGVAGLYDKPTISGQPTTIGSFMSKYSEKSSVGDLAGRQVSGACGSEAKKLDEIDYTDALTFNQQARGQ